MDQFILVKPSSGRKMVSRSVCECVQRAGTFTHMRGGGRTSFAGRCRDGVAGRPTVCNDSAVKCVDEALRGQHPQQVVLGRADDGPGSGAVVCPRGERHPLRNLDVAILSDELVLADAARLVRQRLRRVQEGVELVLGDQVGGHADAPLEAVGILDPGLQVLAVVLEEPGADADAVAEPGQAGAEHADRQRTFDGVTRLAAVAEEDRRHRSE
jgi:hypothetical protein